MTSGEWPEERGAGAPSRSAFCAHTGTRARGPQHPEAGRSYGNMALKCLFLKYTEPGDGSVDVHYSICHIMHHCHSHPHRLILLK